MTGNQQRLIACLLVVLSLQTAYADALDLIPDAILEDTKTSSEQDGQLSNRRTADGIAERWQIRLRSQLQASSSADGETTHSVYANVTATGEHPLGKGRGLADMTLRTRYTHDVTYHVRDDSQLDIKELYYSHPLGHSTHLDLGRINARYGVAFGYNPTDFFKSGVAVDESDFDARSRRNNRLGSVGVRVDHSFAQQSIGLFLSPQINVSADDPLSDARFSGVNLPRSNPQNRLILSLSSSADAGCSHVSAMYTATRAAQSA